MNRQILAVASALVVATLAAAAVVVAASLPADVALPVHWGLDGAPDRYSDKWTALLLPPVLAAAVSALFYVLPALEPRRQGLERSQGLYLWGWTALLFVACVIELAVVAVALRWPVDGNGLVVGGIGIALVIIGNQLGKSRSMYMIGLRTPWTLASEEVWVKTHRLAGKLMVAAGLLVALAAMLPLRPERLGTLFLAAVAVAAGVPILYSYWLWRREGRAAQPSE